MNYLVQRLRINGMLYEVATRPMCERHARANGARPPLPALKGTGDGQILAMVQTHDPCVICAEEAREADVKHEYDNRHVIKHFSGDASRLKLETWEYVVYVCGPMSDKPDFNRPAFWRMERLLNRYGFTVKSPAHYEDEHSYSWYMEQGILMALESNGVVLLKGWKKSRGAKVEASVAGITGKFITEEA